MMIARYCGSDKDRVNLALTCSRYKRHVYRYFFGRYYFGHCMAKSGGLEPYMDLIRFGSPILAGIKGYVRQLREADLNQQMLWYCGADDAAYIVDRLIGADVNIFAYIDDLEVYKLVYARYSYFPVSEVFEITLNNSGLCAGYMRSRVFVSNSSFNVAVSNIVNAHNVLNVHYIAVKYAYIYDYMCVHSIMAIVIGHDRYVDVLDHILRRGQSSIIDLAVPLTGLCTGILACLEKHHILVVTSDLYVTLMALEDIRPMKLLLDRDQAWGMSELYSHMSRDMLQLIIGHPSTRHRFKNKSALMAQVIRFPDLFDMLMAIEGLDYETLMRVVCIAGDCDKARQLLKYRYENGQELLHLAGEKPTIDLLVVLSGNKSIMDGYTRWLPSYNREAVLFLICTSRSAIPL